MGIIVAIVVLFFLFWVILIAGLGIWAFFASFGVMRRGLVDYKKLKASGKPWFTRRSK